LTAATALGRTATGEVPHERAHGRGIVTARQRAEPRERRAARAVARVLANGREPLAQHRDKLVEARELAHGNHALERDRAVADDHCLVVDLVTIDTVHDSFDVGDAARQARMAMSNVGAPALLPEPQWPAGTMHGTMPAN
jgi:hypothetical protein